MFSNLFKNRSKNKIISADKDVNFTQEEIRKYREEISNKLNICEWEKRKLTMQIEHLKEYYFESRRLLNRFKNANKGSLKSRKEIADNEIISFFDNHEIRGL